MEKQDSYRPSEDYELVLILYSGIPENVVVDKLESGG
jgi:hypothetical protein